ncbi:transposase [Bacillus cereus]|uniref:Transposase n=1 Tax=Bacillus cereus TaxID=1396 RepID=A0A2B9DNB1_BACCE|nr:transposase [Bacillus cereus]PGM88966.1 transposase [Bacillus cereus]
MGIFRRRREIYDLKGVDFLYEKKKGRPAMENTNTNTKSKLNNTAIEGVIEALKDENQCLRMEIDYLKKLKALVQKEKKLQNKIKWK